LRLFDGLVSFFGVHSFSGFPVRPHLRGFPSFPRAHWNFPGVGLGSRRPTRPSRHEVSPWVSTGHRDLVRRGGYILRFSGSGPFRDGQPRASRSFFRSPYLVPLLNRLDNIASSWSRAAVARTPRPLRRHYSPEDRPSSRPERFFHSERDSPWRTFLFNPPMHVGRWSREHLQISLSRRPGDGRRLPLP